jgi:hypothetical protein
VHDWVALGIAHDRCDALVEAPPEVFSEAHATLRVPSMSFRNVGLCLRSEIDSERHDPR